MSRLVRWAGRLYPSAWRKRYGAEFDALLEEAAPGGGDLWDVVRGAFIMRIVRLNFVSITVAFALAGALIVGAWSLTVPRRYRSIAVVRAEVPGATTGTDLQRALTNAQQFALSRGSLAAIIMRGNLYSNERTKMPMEDVIARIRNDVRIHPMGSSGVARNFAVEFLYADAAGAQRTVKELVTALQGPMAAQGKLEVLDPASLPQSAIGPDRWRLMGVGLFGGFVAGVLCGGVWTLVRGRSRWSLKRIGAFAGAGMVAGVVVAFLIPNEFESTAVIRSTEVETLATMHKVLSPEALAGIIRKEGLYQRELEHDPMADVVSRMRNKFVRVQMVSLAMPGTAATSRAFVISFRGGDRFQAQRVTRALVAAWVEGNQVAGAKVEMLDPPSEPRAPSYPNRAQIATVGMVGGLLLGLAAVRFRRPAVA